MIRIFANLFIILSIFILPIYFSIFLIFIAILIFNNFIESIVLGYIIDLLYGSGSTFGFHFAYFFTIVIIIFYLLSFKLKKILRMSL